MLRRSLGRGSHSVLTEVAQLEAARDDFGFAPWGRLPARLWLRFPCWPPYRRIGPPIILRPSANLRPICDRPVQAGFKPAAGRTPALHRSSIGFARAAIGLLACTQLFAASWHGARSVTPVEPPGNPLLWKEFGLKSAEQADFGARRITAFEMQDVTGAVAASEWLPGSISLGRMLLTCAGQCPADAKEYSRFLSDAGSGYPPSLPAYLPRQDAISGTERYILGPVALAEFAPGFPSTAVGWQFSPEADLLHYRTPAGEAVLAVFSYPTPQIARQQADGWRKVGGAFVKRTGPLVAIVNGITDKNAAWGLLNQVNYSADVTMNEAAQKNHAKSLANMILSIFALAGILILFCLVSGLVFAGGRVMLRRFGLMRADEAMIALHLSDV